MATSAEYIAFIDLVGIKDALATSPSLYTDKITEFQSILQNQISVIEKSQIPGKDCEVYIFSDCAFIRSRKLSNLTAYLREVRAWCYGTSSPLFFKGAIVSGNLKPSSVKSTSPTLQGATFSKDAVKAYVEHEQSKAIGIVIAQELHALCSEQGELIWNFYFPSERRLGAAVFMDLAHQRVPYSKRNSSQPHYVGVNRKTVDHAKREFHRASLRNLRLARYYPSIFCNWLQSVEFLDLFNGDRMDKTSFDLLEEDDDSPWAAYATVCSGTFLQDFWRVPGVAFLYFVILAKIYGAYYADFDKAAREWKSKAGANVPTALQEIEKFILKIKQLPKELDSIPRALFPPFFRNLYLTQLTSK